MVYKNLSILCNQQPIKGALSALVHRTKAPVIQIDIAAAGSPGLEELLLSALAKVSGHQFPQQYGLAYFMFIKTSDLDRL